MADLIEKLMQALDAERPAYPETHYDIGYNNGLTMAMTIARKFAKDTNVPSKPISHKVGAEPIRVGAGLWCKGTTVYRCPKCQTHVMRRCKYCFECGQALDWSDLPQPPKGE